MWKGRPSMEWNWPLNSKGCGERAWTSRPSLRPGWEPFRSILLSRRFDLGVLPNRPEPVSCVWTSMTVVSDPQGYVDSIRCGLNICLVSTRTQEWKALCLYCVLQMDSKQHWLSPLLSTLVPACTRCLKSSCESNAVICLSEMSHTNSPRWRWGVNPGSFLSKAGHDAVSHLRNKFNWFEECWPPSLWNFLKKLDSCCQPPKRQLMNCYHDWSRASGLILRYWLWFSHDIYMVILYV